MQQKEMDLHIDSHLLIDLSQIVEVELKATLKPVDGGAK
jgi:hypothetical protein